MEINTVIEIEDFADFDILYTECIMVHSDKLVVDDILKEFYSIHGLVSNKGLDYRILRATTHNLISFLESKGFTKLITNKIYFTN